MQQIALVTGGSRGIGAATALLLAEQGYDLCINYKSNQQAAQKLQQQILALGRRVIIFQADISNEADVVRLFNAIDSELGSITALVNNAGILQQQMRVEDMTAQRINQILTTNVTGYFLCCREAVKRMSLNNNGQGGAIVNVGSVASRLGGANEYVDYAASKGAIDTLTTGLALEVAGEGIRVNCVRPGLIYTEMHAAGGEPGRVDRMAPSLPMGRGGQPSEVAQAIVWLLSEQASYATGTFVDLAGGR
ncbi:MAG: SDR family oxidoreductase [Gammaproteobacteria bacterium]|nr:SDR family oxidoreductase [Gammaproteobacteria bacterium]